MALQVVAAAADPAVAEDNEAASSPRLAEGAGLRPGGLRAKPTPAPAAAASPGLPSRAPGTLPPVRCAEPPATQPANTQTTVDTDDANQNASDRGSPWSPRVPASRAELDQMLRRLEAMDGALLPDPPRPKLADFKPSTRTPIRLQRIQRFISNLQYNHTGTNYFAIRKDRGPKRLASTARQIMRESLPIKCIEAVFLGFYLTINMHEVLRIPIRFQSSVQDRRYRFKHIVLAVSYGGRWGALGLSRKHTLMYKELRFDSLSGLLREFRDCYSDIGHDLDHLGVGLPFGHDEHSVEPIHWRPLMLHFDQGETWNEDTDRAIDTFASKTDQIGGSVIVTGQLPSWFHEQFPNVKRAVKDDEAEVDRFADPAPGSPKRSRTSRKPPVPRLSNMARRPSGDGKRPATTQGGRRVSVKVVTHSDETKGEADAKEVSVGKKVAAEDAGCSNGATGSAGAAGAAADAAEGAGCPASTSNSEDSTKPPSRSSERPKSAPPRPERRPSRASPLGQLTGPDGKLANIVQHVRRLHAGSEKLTDLLLTVVTVDNVKWDIPRVSTIEAFESADNILDQPGGESSGEGHSAASGSTRAGWSP